MVNQIVVVQGFAIISVGLSACVLLTALIFPSLRTKLFMQIVCCISMGDLIGNMFYVTVERPRNGTFLCSLQGFLNLYGYPVSWLYTVVLMSFLYGLAKNGRLPLSNGIIHAACLGIPLLLTLLNLTTNSYGRSDDYPDYEVCVLAGNFEDGEIWHYCTYDSLWFICIFVMTYMHFRIRILSRGQLAIPTEQFRSAARTIAKYPVALFVFWFPHMLSVSILNIVLEKYHVGGVYVSALVLKILHGAATALIFFHDSSEARFLWTQLVLRMWSAATRSMSSDNSVSLAAKDQRNSEGLNRVTMGSTDFSQWGEKAYNFTYATSNNYSNQATLPAHNRSSSSTDYNGDAVSAVAADGSFHSSSFSRATEAFTSASSINVQQVGKSSSGSISRNSIHGKAVPSGDPALINAGTGSSCSTRSTSYSVGNNEGASSNVEGNDCL